MILSTKKFYWPLHRVYSLFSGNNFMGEIDE